MKKICFGVVLWTILVSLCAVQTSGVAYAEDLSDTVDQTLDAVDLSAFDELLNGLEGGDFVSGVRELVKDILSGKNDFDFSYFLRFFSGILLGEVRNVLPHLTIIVVVCLLYGILKNLTERFKRTDATKVAYLACAGVVVTVIAHLVAKSVTETTSAIRTMQTISEGCFPVLVTLVAAVGGTASASVFQPMVAVFGAVLLKMITVFVIPLFFSSLVFGLVGNFSEQIKLDKLSKSIRSVAFWAIGLVFGLFSTLLTAQGVTGASVDGLAIRGAKFALSSYVPVVGSYVKEGFDLVVAGCLAVKNGLGLVAVVLLVLTVFIPVVKMAILHLSLKVMAGILQPVSDEKFCSTMVSCAESLKILLVATISAGLSALLFLMTILFVCNVSI